LFTNTWYCVVIIFFNCWKKILLDIRHFPSPVAVAPTSGGLRGGLELPTPGPMAPPVEALITLFYLTLTFRSSEIHNVFIFVTCCCVYYMIWNCCNWLCLWMPLFSQSFPQLHGTPTSAEALHERGMHSARRAHINACTISVHTTPITPLNTPSFCWKLLVRRSCLSVCCNGCSLEQLLKNKEQRSLEQQRDRKNERLLHQTTFPFL